MIPGDSVIEEPEREENTACVLCATVAHSESFPIMKQDMERLCFNGEIEREEERDKESGK